MRIFKSRAQQKQQQQQKPYSMQKKCEKNANCPRAKILGEYSLSICHSVHTPGNFDKKKGPKYFITTTFI